jgi:hypothetical protein
LQDLVAMKALGLNVIGLSDFHFELHASDPGPLGSPTSGTTSRLRAAPPTSTFS